MLTWLPASDGWEGQWHVRVALSGLPRPLEVEFRRACAEDGLEEPWDTSDLMSPLIAVHERSWRWPSQLRTGMEFEGTAELEFAGRRGTVARRHAVLSRSTVSVPAGTYETWAVEVTDTSNSTVRISEVWVAEGIGMVRTVQHLGAGDVTYELVEAALPDH